MLHRLVGSNGMNKWWRVELAGSRFPLSEWFASVAVNHLALTLGTSVGRGYHGPAGAVGGRDAAQKERDVGPTKVDFKPTPDMSCHMRGEFLSKCPFTVSLSILFSCLDFRPVDDTISSFHAKDAVTSQSAQAQVDSARGPTRTNEYPADRLTTLYRTVPCCAVPYRHYTSMYGTSASIYISAVQPQFTK